MWHFGSENEILIRISYFSFHVFPFVGYFYQANFACNLLMTNTSRQKSERFRFSLPTVHFNAFLFPYHFIIMLFRNFSRRKSNLLLCSHALVFLKSHFDFGWALWCTLHPLCQDYFSIFARMMLNLESIKTHPYYNIQHWILSSSLIILVDYRNE